MNPTAELIMIRKALLEIKPDLTKKEFLEEAAIHLARTYGVTDSVCDILRGTWGQPSPGFCKALALLIADGIRRPRSRPIDPKRLNALLTVNATAWRLRADDMRLNGKRTISKAALISKIAAELEITDEDYVAKLLDSDTRVRSERRKTKK